MSRIVKFLCLAWVLTASGAISQSTRLPHALDIVRNEIHGRTEPSHGDFRGYEGAGYPLDRHSRDFLCGRYLPRAKRSRSFCRLRRQSALRVPLNGERRRF